MSGTALVRISKGYLPERPTAVVQIGDTVCKKTGISTPQHEGPGFFAAGRVAASLRSAVGSPGTPRFRGTQG